MSLYVSHQHLLIEMQLGQIATPARLAALGRYIPLNWLLESYLPAQGFPVDVR